MHSKSSYQEKAQKLSKLTEQCYSNLETAHVIANLLADKFTGDKDIDVALDLILSNIKNTEILILNIQENI